MRALLTVSLLILLTGCGVLENPRLARRTEEAVSIVSEPLADAGIGAVEALGEFYGDNFLILWPISFPSVIVAGGVPLAAAAVVYCPPIVAAAGVDEAIRLAAGKEVDISRLITHRFVLEDVSRAFDLVASYSDGVIKAMIDMVPEEGNHIT